MSSSVTELLLRPADSRRWRFQLTNPSYRCSPFNRGAVERDPSYDNLRGGRRVIPLFRYGQSCKTSEQGLSFWLEVHTCTMRSCRVLIESGHGFICFFPTHFNYPTIPRRTWHFRFDFNSILLINWKWYDYICHITYTRTHYIYIKFIYLSCEPSESSRFSLNAHKHMAFTNNCTKFFSHTHPIENNELFFLLDYPLWLLFFIIIIIFNIIFTWSTRIKVVFRLAIYHIIKYE